MNVSPFCLRAALFGRRPLRFVSALAALLLVTFAAYEPAVLRPGLGGAQTRPDAPSVDLYVSNAIGDPTGQRLLPLDPLTLADRLDGSVVDLGASPAFGFSATGGGGTIWVAAADGSVIAGVTYARSDYSEPLRSSEVTIVVRQGLDGPERFRLHPPGRVLAGTRPLLSADGSLLLLQGVPPAFHANTWGHAPKSLAQVIHDARRRAKAVAPRLYVVNTRTAVVQTIAGINATGDGIWLDPTGRRLYDLVVPVWRELLPTSPGSLRVVAYGLTDGRCLGEITLPDVPIGSWQTSSGDVAQARPGIALSPDGERLAVVHPDLSAVTFVETQHLTIENVLALHRSTGALDRLIGLLPFAPRTAAAKGLEFGFAPDDAVFSPDGRQLYAWGLAPNSLDGGHPSTANLSRGLARIDLAFGTIAAESFADRTILDVMPAPDGRTLYVRSETPAYAPVLLRVDAMTLGLETQRVFDYGGRWFVLRSVAAG